MSRSPSTLPGPSMESEAAPLQLPHSSSLQDYESTHKDDEPTTNGHGYVHAPNVPPPATRARKIAAFFVIAAAVISWVAKAAVVQDLQNGSFTPAVPPSCVPDNSTSVVPVSPLSDVSIICPNGTTPSGGHPAVSSSYDKPYLISYLNVMAYSLLLIIFVSLRWKTTVYGVKYISRRAKQWLCGGCASSTKSSGDGQGRRERLRASDDDDVRENHHESADGDGVRRHGASHLGRNAHPTEHVKLDMRTVDGEEASEKPSSSPANKTVSPNSTSADPLFSGSESMAANARLNDDGHSPLLESPPSKRDGRASSAPTRAELQSKNGRRMNAGKLNVGQGQRPLPTHVLGSAALARRFSELPETSRKVLPLYGTLLRLSMFLSPLYLINIYLTNLSLDYTTLSVNTSIWNSLAIFIFILEGIFLGEKLKDLRKICGVIVCCSGVTVIALDATGENKTEDSTDTSTQTTIGGVIAVLLAVLLYGCYEVCFKYFTEGRHTARKQAKKLKEQRERENQAALDNEATSDEHDRSSSLPSPSRFSSESSPTLTQTHSTLVMPSPSAISSASTVMPRTSSVGSDSPQRRGSASSEGSRTTSPAISPSPSGSGSESESESGSRSSSSPPSPMLIPVQTPVAALPASASFVSAEVASGVLPPADAHVHLTTTESLLASCLFLGSMGLAVGLFGWLLLPVLDASGAEKLETPSPSARNALLGSMIIDALLNMFMLLGVALSTPLTVTCALLFTIPTSILWDMFAHGHPPGTWSLVGIGILLIGFFTLNWPTSKEHQHHQHHQQHHDEAGTLAKHLQDAGHDEVRNGVAHENGKKKPRMPS